MVCFEQIRRTPGVLQEHLDGDSRTFWTPLPGRAQSESSDTNLRTHRKRIFTVTNRSVPSHGPLCIGHVTCVFLATFDVRNEAGFAEPPALNDALTEHLPQQCYNSVR